jgi:hypothetical protein
MRDVKRSSSFGRKKLPIFEVARLELNEGDIVVVRTELWLSKEQQQFLYDRTKAQFAPYKVAVLSGGLSLAVLRKNGAAGPPHPSEERKPISNRRRGRSVKRGSSAPDRPGPRSRIPSSRRSSRS